MFKSDFFVYSTWRKEGSSFLNDLLYLCVRHYYSFIMPEKCQKFKHRSYSSIHAFSWAISLERYGYTNCMFRDCHFMALDLDVMALHHYECPGGGNNESLFMCAVCKRGTSDQVTLNNHYFLAHPEEARIRGISTVSFTQTMPKILSNVRKKSWEIFLERKGYIKCLIQNCQFITDEVNVMKEHYYYCSKGLPNGNMSNTCPTCCGITNNKEFFERHCNKCNKLAEHSANDYFAPQPNVTIEMIHMWTENIRKYKAAKCSRSGCRFIDNNVMALKTHFIKCKTIPNPVQIVCHICGGWLSSGRKLEEHLQSVHKPHEAMPNLVLVLQANDNENNFMYEMLSRTQFLANGDESCSLHTSYEEDSENQQNYKIELKVAEEEKKEESQTGNNRSIPNRRIFKTYQKTCHKKTVHPSIEVLIPGKTRKIDYVKTKQLSSIQYGRNFVEKNTELLGEVNVRDDRRRRRCCEQQSDYDFPSEDIRKMEGTYFSPLNFGSTQPINPAHRVHFNLKANHMRTEPKQKTPDLTPLAKIANKLMNENKELPIPVNISVEDRSWTVSVSPSVVGGPKLTGNIIDDFNSIGQYMRREANILLRCARTKNTVYNKQTYQKRYQTRFKEQSMLPKLDFFPRLEQDSVFDITSDYLYGEEEDISRNPKIKDKSYSNIGIISHCNMVNFTNKNLPPANAARMQTYSRNEKENHHKVNRNKKQLIEVSQMLGKTINPPSINRNAHLENNDCTMEQNCNQDDSLSLETIAEDTESEDDVCIISDNDICAYDKGQHKVIANNKKNKNKGVINVKGRPLIFDDQELEIILLNPNNIETSSVNANNNNLRKSSMDESANIPKNDLVIMVDRGHTSGEEENSQGETNITGISSTSDVIDKEILKSIGSNANEVLTSEVSIMPLNTKNDPPTNDGKNISAISVKENSIRFAPASKIKDDQKNVTLTVTNHALSKDISTENDLIEQKLSSTQSNVASLCAKNTNTDLSEGEHLSINKHITDVRNEGSFTDISSKFEIDSKESTNKPETLDIFSSSSISMGLLSNLSGKPKNKKSSLSDSGQEFCTSKRVAIKKINYKKGDLKKCKVKGKNDCFLGFAENSSSCNKLNHLLSYCNILGITAELQTYPIHVKFDVTPNKPGNSANNVDSKGNNNKNKESGSNEENNKIQQKSEETITKSPDDNPSNSSKKRKLEKKTGKAQKQGDQNTKNTGGNSDKLVEEYNSFVGSLGKTSTPFVKRNEKKSGNTDVDTTVEPNIRDQTEESSSMSTTISRNDSVEQNETDVSFAESEKTLKKDETSSRTEAKDDNNELGNSPVSKPTSVIHGEQTSKEGDADETNKMNKKDDNDKNKDQTTRRRNEKSGESKQNANDSNDSSEDGPAKKKGRLEGNEQKLISETLPKEKDTTESRKSILSEYLMSRNHSTSGEVQSLTKRKRGRPRKTHIPNIVEEQSNLPAKNSGISEKKNSDQALSKPEESLDNGRVSSASKSQKENISESHQDTIDISISELKSESNFSETDLKNESNTSQEEYTSAHLPPSPPPVKRKPGRPRKNPLPTRIFESGLLDTSGPSAPGDMDFNDLNDSGNKRGPFGRPRRQSLSRQPAASADTIENLDSVGSCAICKESMTIRDFQKKHFQIHNFMCWMDGDEPLDLECENTIVNWLIRWKKKFPKHLFKCEKCGETKKSVKGFLSHIQFCGKTLEERQRLMVACPICGRVMMPSSLEQHRPLCSKKVPPPKESLGEMALSTRKAAKQCLETIADLAPNLLDDGKSKKRKRNDPKIENLGMDSDEDMLEVIGDSTSQKQDEVKELYTLKTKRSTKHLRTIWELAVADGKVLHCPCPSCEFSSLTFNEMNEHYRTCEYDFQGYICKDCRYTSNSEKDMVKHVKTIHSDHLQLIKEGERVAPPVRREEYGTGSIYIPFLRKAELSFSGSAKISKFFRPALGWTQQQRALNYTMESIFPEYKFVPELWQELNFNSIEPYLPEKKQSVKFCCKNSSNWSQLKLFESRVLSENMCIMFTGGPVWGLAWAPGSTDIQYLAVSTHLSMHSNFRMGSVHTGPGVVQIWSLKNLNNFSNLSDEQVKLEYVFCHDYGGCWALEWCPAGCQDNARIGLLAIATTSGIIPLFAVPTPQVLNAALHYEQAKHYKPEPALLLKLSPFVNSQCTRLSWSKVKPHRSLVAGFTNGIIGVWDLNSQSVLLRSGITLYPYKTFNAHHSNITGLCLSPASETYLVSSALDKTVKFWDLNDTTAPHSIHRRGLVNDVAWMQHWLCAVAVYDESYMTSQTTVALHSVRDYIFQPGSFISNVKSSAWCVSVSDWLNAIAISYDNGQITVAFAKQQDPTNEKRDEKKKLVKVVLETSLFDFDKNMPLSSNNESIEEAASANAQNSSLAGSTSSVSEKPSTSSVDQYEPRTVDCCTFEEVSEKYGVQFDCDINFKKETLLKGNQANPIDIYPIMSANKVTWNPNRHALLSMAVGYQSGFVVIPKLTLPLFDEKFVESFLKSSKGNVEI